jgi:hypothetical protein
MGRSSGRSRPARRSTGGESIDAHKRVDRLFQTRNAIRAPFWYSGWAHTHRTPTERAREAFAGGHIPICAPLSARERRSSLLNEGRGSKRLEEAAERLGRLLRSNNMATAMWADSVIKRHILPEPAKHLPFPYMKRPYD